MNLSKSDRTSPLSLVACREDAKFEPNQAMHGHGLKNRSRGVIVRTSNINILYLTTIYLCPLIILIPRYLSIRSTNICRISCRSSFHNDIFMSLTLYRARAVFTISCSCSFHFIVFVHTTDDYDNPLVSAINGLSSTDPGNANQIVGANVSLVAACWSRISNMYYYLWIFFYLSTFTLGLLRHFLQ